jgi:FKBP-type peptidyl-prolyl cis-trans isomerase
MSSMPPQSGLNIAPGQPRNRHLKPDSFGLRYGYTSRAARSSARPAIRTRVCLRALSVGDVAARPGEKLGEVEHVLADADLDVFDGSLRALPLGLPTMKAISLTILLCSALFAAGCGRRRRFSDERGGLIDLLSTGLSPEQEKQEREHPKPEIKVPDEPPPKELVVKDLKEVSGAVVGEGVEIVVEYVAVAYKTGKEFETVWGKPTTFTVDSGEVIRGWEQGIRGMKGGWSPRT